MNKMSHQMFIFIMLSGVVFGFQNCSQSGFENITQASSQAKNSTGSADAFTPTPSPEPSSSLFNFVSDSKDVCEQSIASRLNVQISCSVGGGCGVTCGKPGGNCVSANPSHYGACVGASDVSRAPAAAPNQPAPPENKMLYNFVAGSKDDCESSIQSRLSVTGVCTVGGGCGVTCGMPGSSCPSANPTSYGACILH